MPKTLVILGMKGGVGRTTIAASIAAALGTERRPAVLVDLDPNGSATGWLLPEAPPTTLQDDLRQGRPLRAYPAPKVPGLLVAPSHVDLADLDDDLTGAFPALQKTLKAPANSLGLVVDSAPSYGALVASALLLADAVLIVVQCTPLGLGGLTETLDLVDEVRERNGGLKVLGIVPNRRDRTRASRLTEERLWDRYKRITVPVRAAAVLTEVPLRNVTIWQAPEHPVKDDLLQIVSLARRGLR